MSNRSARDSETAKKIDFLKKVQFFADFDDHELRQFMAVSTWLKVKKGTEIIKENTVERAFYILVKGEVSVVKNQQGSNKPLELTRLSTGDCFGEMALIGEVRRTAGVVTSSRSFILKVEPDIISTSNVFLQLKFYKRFCEIMVSRLDKANKQMVSRTPANPPCKPARRERSKIGNGEGVEPALPPLPEKKERASQQILQRQLDPADPLPVNPLVARNIQPFLSGDWTNTRQFADLIYLDPVLSFRVLKVANSSLYRRSCQITSVPHALVSVGPAVVQEEISRTINDSRKVELFDHYPALAESFWQHSVVVGKIAALLRDVLRLINLAPDVYLAGLLHDIGTLAIDPCEPDFYPQLLREKTEFSSISAAEKDYIGVDHGLAGKWLAEKSGLPAAYQDVMRFHHYPEKAIDNVLLVSLVHLANLFAAERGVCQGPPELIGQDPYKSEAWALIRMEVKNFANVNVADFIADIDDELDRSWPRITDEIIF